jgi:ABC-2 type transport system ATP-binding protein
VLWNGTPAAADDRRRFGYMPEERGLYPKMGVLDQLVFFARLARLHPGRRRPAGPGAARRARSSARVRTTSCRSCRWATSSGRRSPRRSCHDPDLLVLDEPFSGLDPVAVDVMAALLRRRAAAGVPVLFSSHQLDLVERLCDDVVIINRGRVHAAGHAADLREQRAGARYELRLGETPGGCATSPAFGCSMWTALTRWSNCPAATTTSACSPPPSPMGPCTSSDVRCPPSPRSSGRPSHECHRPSLIAVVARREILARVRDRTFIVSTIFLLVLVAASSTCRSC